jgi:hypothetical protein
MSWQVKAFVVPASLLLLAALGVTPSAPDRGFAAESVRNWNFGSGQSGGSTSRSITAQEDGKTISISESSDSGITVKTTETVEGKPRESVVRAPNAATLAKHNPKAYELYQRYLDAGGSATAVAGSGGTASATGGGTAFAGGGTASAAGGTSSATGSASSGGGSSAGGTSGHRSSKRSWSSTSKSSRVESHGGTTSSSGKETSNADSAGSDGMAKDARIMVRQHLEDMRKQHSNNPLVQKQIDRLIEKLDSEIGGQKAEIGGQKAEVGGQKAEAKSSNEQ